MSVYGDTLCFFPELIRKYYYLTMLPKVGSSYGRLKILGAPRGAFQKVKRGELQRTNDTLSNVDVPTFWTRENLSIGNFFIQEKKGATMYRIVKNADFLFEAGFNCYELETVVGNTGTQKPIEGVNLGASDYA